MNDRNDLNTNGEATQDSIVVRPFEHGDNEKIMQVDWSNEVENSYAWRDGKLILMKEQPVYVGPDYSKEEKVEQIKRVEQQLDDPEAITIGAFHDGVLVGYVCINTLRNPDTNEKWWCLWQMVVSSRYRHRGIAARMFEVAKKKASEVCRTGICLLATPSEEAVRCYLSVGFEPLEKPSWWNDNGIYMEMKL